ncbi:MAG TPA: acetylornithine transaminase [bacterium]|nr:acetylornithine transaminase [bacterium]
MVETTAAVQAVSEQYLMATYRRAPVAFAAGQGVWLTDLEGRRYLDFLAGIAVCALGHAHPALTAAIRAQAGRLLHVSNLFLIPEQAALARALTRLSGLDRAFFCNSGAEANEAAIKLVRRYWHRRGVGRFEIIVAEQSFHGRTMGTLAATAQPKYQQGFAPLPPGFVAVPFDDLAALRAAVTPATAAVMLEVVQGEGGYRVPSPAYLPQVRRLCDEQGILLVLDEVQTGMGRTGRWFAGEHYGVRPDVMTLAKGLGGGVPIGALLAAGPVAEAFQPGDHGSTFGGNPLACAAALAVIETIEREHLVEHAAQAGAHLVERLRALARRQPAITAVRGLGLMVAVDLGGDAAQVVAEARQRGLIINAVQPTTLRLAPPLIVSEAEIDQAVEILDAALAAATQPAAV